MIGVPFGNNDLECLSAISEVMVDLVERRDPLLLELAEQYRTTHTLADWIRSLPQRDDEGLPGDGPKVEACEPVQRLRIPAPDPNCVERAALYLGVAELIDPHPVRQLATLDFDWGRHTFPIENGAPVVLDPRVSADDLAHGVTAAEASAIHDHPAPAPESEPPRKRQRKRNRIAVGVYDALEFTSQLGEEATRDHRNGPRRAWVARNAIRSLLETRTPPTDPQTVDTLHWFFQEAERLAQTYGRRALAIVKTTAAALWDLIDDILAEEEHHQRNLDFSFNGSQYTVPGWLSDAAGVAGKIGVDLGAAYARPYLLAAGVTNEMLSLVEQELNHEGYSMGPLANQNQSVSYVLAKLAAEKGK